MHVHTWLILHVGKILNISIMHGTVKHKPEIHTGIIHIFHMDDYCLLNSLEYTEKSIVIY